MLWPRVAGAFAGCVRASRSLVAASELDAAHAVQGVILGLLGFFAAALFLHLVYGATFWMLTAIAFAVPVAYDSRYTATLQERRPRV